MHIQCDDSSSASALSWWDQKGIVMAGATEKPSILAAWEKTMSWICQRFCVEQLLPPSFMLSTITHNENSHQGQVDSIRIGNVGSFWIISRGVPTCDRWYPQGGKWMEMDGNGSFFTLLYYTIYLYPGCWEQPGPDYCTSTHIWFESLGYLVPSTKAT